SSTGWRSRSSRIDHLSSLRVVERRAALRRRPFSLPGRQNPAEGPRNRGPHPHRTPATEASGKSTNGETHARRPADACTNSIPDDVRRRAGASGGGERTPRAPDRHAGGGGGRGRARAAGRERGGLEPAPGGRERQEGQEAQPAGQGAAGRAG